MDAITVPRKRRGLVLPCTLLLLVAAPACLAQQAADAEVREGAAIEAPRGQAAGEQPRSAFGRVMSLMIAALKENASDDADGSADVAVAATGDAAAATPPRDIQVSAAFRLDAPPRSEPREPREQRERREQRTMPEPSSLAVIPDAQ